ncbi:MAG TPA: serine/threonine-protein kinase [Drouetiella sp.]
MTQQDKPEDQSLTELSAKAGDGVVDDNPFVIGSVVEGKFKILEVLGRGGMGAVYRARQLLLNTDVALKTLNAGLANDTTAMRRFQTEARAAFSLKHRNLVDVHDFGVLESGHPFITMEMIEGNTLQDVLKKCGSLPLKEAEAMFVQLCHGLGYAHLSGVVHRDIKPGNIMLLKDKDVTSEVAVKILDFGIAKVVNTLDSESEALTKTGELFGSPLYMSPEQCSGGAIDKRTDIYSLGCVFFEALTGTPPFVGQNPLRTMMMHQSERPPTLREATMGKDFPAYLERIVGRMLAKEPSRRYQDLSEVSRELLSNAHSVQAKQGDMFPSLFETPFTKSDTTQGQGQKGKVTISWLQLSLVAIPVIGISLAIGFLVHADHSTANNAKRQVERKDEKDISGFTKIDNSAKIYLANTYNTAKILYAKAKPIVKKEVEREGQKQLEINFPELPLGKIAVNYFTLRKQPIDINAVNNVFVPLDDPLTFIIDPQLQPEVAMNSFVFDKIAPNIFTGVAVYGDPSVISLVTDEKATNTQPGVEHLFRDASRWTKMSEVTIVQSKITRDIVNSLKKMDKLSLLKLRNCPINTEEFYDPEIFGRLKVVLLSLTPADPVFRVLSGSKKIETIEIDGKCELHPKSIAGLAYCPNLKSIRFGSETLAPDTVSELAKLKTLKKLGFNPKSLSADDRKLLTDANYKVLIKNLDAIIFVRN